MTEEAVGDGRHRILHARRWMFVAPCLLLLWLIGQIDKTNISLVIVDRDFLQELKLVGRNAELGGLMSAFFVGYGAAIFGWGFLVDRLGPRTCAIAGTAAWGVVLFLASRVTSAEGLLLLRFFLGVAEGNLWPVSNVLTNRWFPAGEHSRVQAFWITGSTLGTAAGVPLVTALILVSGWRGALVSLALLSLLPVGLFYFVSDRPEIQKGISSSELREIESGRKNSAAVERMSFTDLLRSSPFWLITACQMISATTIYTLIHWIPSFVTLSRRLSLERMGGWITAGYMLATALTWAIGWVADRRMQRSLTAAWVCLLFALAVLPGALLLPAAGSALVLSTLIAVASSTAALNGALMHELVRPEVIARGTGAYVGIGNFVSGAGPTVFGLLINALGGQYWGGFVFLALLNALGAGCYLTLHRRSSSNTRAALRAPVPKPLAKEP